MQGIPIPVDVCVCLSTQVKQKNIPRTTKSAVCVPLRDTDAPSVAKVNLFRQYFWSQIKPNHQFSARTQVRCNAETMKYETHIVSLWLPNKLRCFVSDMFGKKKHIWHTSNWYSTFAHVWGNTFNKSSTHECRQPEGIKQSACGFITDNDVLKKKCCDKTKWCNNKFTT